jgi:hypothetical protein
MPYYAHNNNNLYAMQRANGDWFAVEDHGRLRMPIFHSSKAAMVARSRHSEMECFRPMMLDQRAVQNLETEDGTAPCFWLVGDPSTNLRRGRPLDFDQFSELVHDLAERRG